MINATRADGDNGLFHHERGVGVRDDVVGR